MSGLSRLLENVGRPVLAAAALSGLPHWDAVGQPLFVTFRLHGSLPAHRVFPPASLTLSGKAFVSLDRLLNRATIGASHLHRSEIAELVAAALHDGEISSTSCKPILLCPTMFTF